MKNLLHEILDGYKNNDEIKRQLENYGRYIELPEGRFVKDTFLIIKGTIMNTMLSASYTKLDQTEKDVMQRTFYNITQMLDFLISPVKVVKKKESQLHNLADKRNPVGKKGR
jgi:hypothetical protein